MIFIYLFYCKIIHISEIWYTTYSDKCGYDCIETEDHKCHIMLIEDSMSHYIDVLKK